MNECETQKWVATALDITTSELGIAMAQRSMYNRVFIPKKGKKGHKARKRVLHVPPPELKRVQKQIKKAFDWLEWPNYVHGFVKGRSNLTAAAIHRGSGFLLTIDFKNAFDSVTLLQVEEALTRHIGLDDTVANMLAELATHNGRLPQGSPSSPLLFNLVVLDLDSQVFNFCNEHGFAYTRYVDEIIVSSRKPIPKANRWAIIKMCFDFGFRIAPEKVYYQDSARQTLAVVGILLRTSGIGLSNRRKVDNLRAMLHHAEQGDNSISPESIIGKLGWVKRIDPSKLRTRLGKYDPNKFFSRQYVQQVNESRK